ncbi:MAG: hypothetical protein GX374_00540 [Bacilli bacterium]|nr:hypothetical protein [Bacilli bacterium]
MELKKATAVSESKLHSFIGKSGWFHNVKALDEPSSYVIKDGEMIISWFQLESIDGENYWLKKLFISQNEAMKLPSVMHTIIQYAEQQNAKTIYVHSKQPVTDLLLASFSFALQDEHSLQPFQKERTGNWWFYRF